MKLIVLNHKMTLYYEELMNYINKINDINKNLIIAPTSIYLIEFLNKCHHKIASQDICYIEKGNHTGKVSWKQVKQLGIKYSLIGHNEKQDNIEKINQKIDACINNEIVPIICFGNKNKEEDITKILDDIKLKNIDKVIFAYEPIFNIGKKEIDIQHIKEEINKIYEYLFQKFKKIPIIIYGGGIKEENINEIYNIDKLKGIIIGSISSNIDELNQLLLNINEK